MNYGTKYIVPFKTISDIPCEIRFDVKGYIGEVRELIAGGNPIIIEVESSDVYTPIRSSSATVSVYGSDYLQDLYASDPFGVKVTLKVNNTVKWLGYITQDTFSQDFSKPEFIYEIECVSALSVLKYKRVDLTSKQLTFLGIIKGAMKHAGYSNAYLTNSVKTDRDSNLYSNFKVASANFIDELGDVESYYDVLSEIAKYVTCTFTPFRESLMLVNYEAIKNNSNYYYRIDDNQITGIKLEDITTVQELGYKGTGATVSRIGGRNKVSVNCSLYETDSDVMHKISNQGMMFLSSAEYRWHNKKRSITAIEHYYTNIDNEGFSTYVYPPPYDSITGLPIGAKYLEYAEFQTDDPPAELSMAPLILVDNGSDTQGGLKIFTLRSKSDAITSGEEYFILNFDYRRTTKDNRYDLGNNIGIEHGSSTDRSLDASLRFGDLYYNGSGWQKRETTFGVKIPRKDGNLVSKWESVRNENTYDKNIGGSKGQLIKAPSGVMIGDIELSFYSEGSGFTNYEHYKNISLDIATQKKELEFGDYISEQSKNDVIYEREIAGDFVEEADEISLKLCTKQDNKTGYSFVFTDAGFVKTYKYMGELVQPEHCILNKQASLFSKPRFVINPTLTNAIKPYSLISDENLKGSVFCYAGGSEDVKMERETMNLIEI